MSTQEQREHKRALVLMASGSWIGWFCEGCSWNHPLPASETERGQLARRIKQLFDEHCCEEMAAIPGTNG